jgi:hypothetical protein
VLAKHMVDVRPACNREEVGSNPTASSNTRSRDRAARSARLAHNQEAAGSNPARATNPRPAMHIDAIGIPAGQRTGKVTSAATEPDQFSRQA